MSLYIYRKVFKKEYYKKDTNPKQFNTLYSNIIDIL